MKRKAINPANDWGAGFEMNQAEIISEFNEILKFSGQTSLITDSSSDMGLSVKFPGDQKKQMEFILGSIDNLLEQAGMTRENIICLLYTSPSPRDRQKSRMPSSA